MKTKTYGQVAANFYNEKEAYDFKRFVVEVSAHSLIYKGRIADLSKLTASGFASLHKDFYRYYQDAMAVLYEYPNGGTEDPVMSLQMPKDYEYVVVWHPLGE